ncbi:MAG: metallophosphoesterase family protein [Candidatus Thermoplasmatota archaeon]
MIICVVSDSHGELDNLKNAAVWAKEKEKAETILHLGDESEDAHVLAPLGLNIIAIPGVYEAKYQDHAIPNRLIEEYNNWKVLLTHTVTAHENDLPEDIKPEELIAQKKVSLILYGHTHIPLIEERNGIIYVNPGHLKKDDKKKYKPSFGIIKFEENYVEIRLIRLEDKQEFAKYTHSRE